MVNEGARCGSPLSWEAQPQNLHVCLTVLLPLCSFEWCDININDQKECQEVSQQQQQQQQRQQWQQQECCKHTACAKHPGGSTAVTEPVWIAETTNMWQQCGWSAYMPFLSWQSPIQTVCDA